MNLDRLMAEKVMGWHEEDIWWVGKNGKDRGMGEVGIDYWHPTTDISQAMMVVEKMVKNGWGFELSTWYVNAHWGATFSRKEEPYNETLNFRGQATTPALAICRAIKEAWDGQTGYNQSLDDWK